VFIPMFAVVQLIFKLLLGLMAVFLILLVLVQRGRGGGLAGALGGMGGSSAFGAKAGDVFTKVTVVAATIWILLCIAADKLGPASGSRISTGNTPAASSTMEEDAPALERVPGDEAEEEVQSETGSATDADGTESAGEAVEAGSAAESDSNPTSPE